MLAVGIGGLVLMAVWAAQRTFRVSIRRRLTSPRVARGDPIRIVYRVINDGRHRSGRAAIRDQCGGRRDLGRRRAARQAAGGRPAGADPDPTPRHLRCRSVVDRAPRPVRPGHRPSGGGLDGDGHRPSACVRPARPARFDEHRGGGGAGPPDGDRSAVGVRVAARVRPRRRPAPDPLDDDRSHRDADGQGARRAAASRVHGRARHRRPRRHAGRFRGGGRRRGVDRRPRGPQRLDVVVRTTSRQPSGTPDPAIVRVAGRRPAHARCSRRRAPTSCPSRRCSEAASTRPRSCSSPVPTARRAGSRSSDQMLTVRIGEGAQSGPGVALAVADASEFTQRWKPWSG